jgi:oxalate decarboxylase
MFRSDRYADISLNQWLALTPPELVQAHLNLDDATTTAVTAYKGKPIIIQ